MTRIGASVTLLAVLAHTSHAEDSIIGLHFGASVGQSNIRVDQRPGDIFLGLKENHSAWKVFAGIRPISLLGVEYAHQNLGRPSSTLGAAGTSSAVEATVKQEADSLFAVLYLPLPAPWLDVFAKGGQARVQTKLSGTLPGVACVVAGCNTFSSKSTTTRSVMGLGVQLRIPATDLSMRFEYERFSTGNGDPHLVTTGVLWAF